MTDALGRRQGPGRSYPTDLSYYDYFSSLYESPETSAIDDTPESTATSVPTQFPTTSTAADQGSAVALTIQTTVSFDSATADLVTTDADQGTLTLTFMSPSSANSLSDTTFQTSFTASSNPDSIPSSSSVSDATPLPSLTHGRHHGALSGGALAAAVVAPLIVALVFLLFALVCLWRRRQRRRRSLPDGHVPLVREKSGSWRRPKKPAPSTVGMSEEIPVVIREGNNAYFTGLDTSSHGSSDARDATSGEFYAPRRSEGGTFVDPPPPYKTQSLESARSVRSPAEPLRVPLPAGLALPRIREPEPLSFSFNDHFDDGSTNVASPESSHQHTTTESGRDLLVPWAQRPGPSRSDTNRSARSITSTLYSDTASVHSAHAARMSVGGAQVIRTCTNGESNETPGDISPELDRNPFDDPDSPVSSM